MKLELLKDLYLAELQDLHSAESQIIEALPKMARAATSPELTAAFEAHLKETRGQLERLDQILKGLGAGPGRKKCKGMAGLITEGEELIEEKPDPDVLDAGLIAAAQKVEHYEIASYGTVRTYARLLGEAKAAGLLQQTLNEEGATDKKLTALAERGINEDAATPG